jgi:peptidoglycan/LPS O-acetylase OafA/YrhL
MRYSALDGWRGVCALLVAAAHVCGNMAWTGGATPPFFDGCPYVDFFFVLSGFVIGYTYESRIDDIRSAGVFMLRRFGRLWPLHATMLALYILFELMALIVERHWGNFAAFPAFTADKSPSAVVTNLLLIQSLGIEDGFTWNSPSWSISVEFWTYLVFAGLLLTAGPRRAAAALVLLAVGIAGVVLGGEYMLAATRFGLFRCLYGFFLGYLVFRFTLRPHAEPALKGPVATAIEIVAVVLIVLYIAFLREPPWSLLGPPLFGLCVYIFSLERGAISRRLSAAPFRQLGTWSYSIYMIHMLMLTLLMVALRILQRMFHLPFRSTVTNGVTVFDLGSMLLNDAVVIGLLLAVVSAAALSYRFIEVPSRRYFNAVADQLAGHGRLPHAAKS